MDIWYNKNTMIFTTIAIS